MIDNARQSGLGMDPLASGAEWTDPGLLVNGDPQRVQELLDLAQAPEAQLVAAVYRKSAHLHREATANVRRQVLALDAARHGDRELSARISAVTVNDEPSARWRVEWATGSQVDPRPQDTLTGHTGGVLAVATAAVNGRPVVVSGGEDGTVRLWDLTTGQPTGEPLTGHVGPVCAVATAVVDGRQLAFSGGGHDGTLRVWDLAAGQLVSEHPASPHNSFTAVATGVEKDRPVIVISDTGFVWAWDPADDWWDSMPLNDGGMMAVASTVVEGRPVAVGGSEEGELLVWDLATTQQVDEPLTDHTGEVMVATAVVDGRPLAVTGDEDGTVRVWDLATHRRVGEPLEGHTDAVTALTTGVMHGRPIAVSGGEDGTVRLWDLTTSQQAGGDLVFPAPVRATAVSPEDRLVVGFGWEVAVLAPL